MKTIIVTGSNGMTGQKIVYALRDMKDVKCISTSVGPNRMSAKDGYIYESLDITNKTQVENIFSKYKPDAVINTAAMTNVDECEIKKAECRALNVEAVEHLVGECKKYNTHLV